MAEKIVHVDAYTRSDGTYVREHERHINTDNYDYSLEENGVPYVNKNGILPIKLARSVQEHGKFHNYYTLIKIRI